LGVQVGLWITAASLPLATGCGLFNDTASATWRLAPDQRVGADVTKFTVLVTRLGCNGGVTGEVQPPAVDYQDRRIVLTFVVKPGEPSSATCQGNDQVPYDVSLEEPLGDRQLVDGQCLSGGEARDTLDCEAAGGSRITPPG
jgi:hypothetical protein